MELCVADVMTREPTTVDPDTMAFDALRLMEDRPSQISVLPVVVRRACAPASCACTTSSGSASERARRRRAGPVDPLNAPDAGARAVRGGSLRVLGYGIGALCALLTAPFVIRYLGVEEFGSYVAALALISIVALVSDAGLTLVGLREYAVRDEAGRARLLDSLMALRLAVVCAGVAVAVGFAAISGYAPALIAGTALAGAGLLLIVVEQTCSVALSSQLRFGAVTLLEVGRAALTAAGLLALVALGAGVTALMAISIPVGVVIALLARHLLRGHGIRPRFDRAEWAYLIREAIPVAIASSIGSLFYRSAIVVMSITATSAQTSYFGASYRILEALIVIPGLLCATAFPIIARAADEDEDRTAFALQALADVGLVLGAVAGLTLALAARPVVLLLAGEDFEPAIPVLQIQAAALPATFLVAVWATGLWAVRGQRRLAIANCLGVAIAVTLSVIASVTAGAQAVAAAMLVAEWLLAALYLAALVRERPGLRPSARVVPKVVLAAALGCTAFLLPIPDLARAACGAVAYALAILLLRAMPPAAWQAFTALRTR